MIYCFLIRCHPGGILEGPNPKFGYGASNFQNFRFFCFSDPICFQILIGVCDIIFFDQRSSRGYFLGSLITNMDMALQEVINDQK